MIYTKKMVRFYGVVVCLLCLQGMFSAAQAAVVSFNNNALSVNESDTFSLTIMGSAFPEIVGGGLNLDFDPAVVQIDSVAINTTVFDFYTAEGSLDNLVGTLTDTSFNTFAGVSGSFDIMTIGFTAVGAGVSTLMLSESSIAVFSDSSGNTIGDQISYETATITVSAVPVPAAIWLFASGLIGLARVVRQG